MCEKILTKLPNLSSITINLGGIQQLRGPNFD